MSDNGLERPDIAVVDETRRAVAIVDVRVMFENLKTALECARHGKVDKYRRVGFQGFSVEVFHRPQTIRMTVTLEVETP